MTVYLKDILAVLTDPILDGNPLTVVSGVTHDSRKVCPGWIFVAVPGEKSDGHRFIANAVEAGAAAVIARSHRSREFAEVPWIRVADTRVALGPVSAVVYRRPTTRMTLVGITGTNGKTTLTFLLEAILKSVGARPGVIGTISYRWHGKEHAAGNTTPEASDLQWILSQMADAGVTHAIMEVSSHGLHQGRLEGCEFDLGVFTNLTQDHLDYHGTFDEYYIAKRILFDRFLANSSKSSRAAVVNLDDSYGRRLVREGLPVPVIGYGTTPDCAVYPKAVSLTSDGISALIETPVGAIPVDSRLAGSFNLSNILAAVAASAKLGIPVAAVREGIAQVAAVPGRLERVVGNRGTIFVDYAHTPDALKNVLAAVKSLSEGRIVTVMGCGGDRDKTKRPIMGMEAAAGSDFVVVTSDNPRTEEPLDIIRQVEEGVRDYGFSPVAPQSTNDLFVPGHYTVIPDRRAAIGYAVKLLKKRDVLLVAGKGHETYQEINGVRYAFDDREVIREELSKLEGPVEGGRAAQEAPDPAESSGVKENRA